MNIFYFVNKWPRSKQNARFDKIISLMQTFINKSYHVTMFSSDTTDPDSSPDLQNVPIETVFLHPKKIMQGLASSVKKPDLCVFNSVQMEKMYSIFMYSKWNKCPRVLQVNELKGLEEWRRKNYLTMGSPFLIPYDVPIYPEVESPMEQKFTSDELEAIKRSDYFFCGNDFISFYLNKHLKVNNYILSSMGIPIGDFKSEISERQFREHRHRKHFVFIGNLFREKNVRMINQIIEKIWPNIRKELPNVELHIYGAGKDKSLLERKKELEKIGVLFKGLMEDPQVIQKYRAMLYPVQYTTGTKGAITQSWFQHTPVVTTPIGAQGLFQETSEPMFSATQKGQVYSGFFKERILTNEQEDQKKKVKKYYSKGILSDEINKLSFGGLCNNFSYSEFIQSAIKIYTDEKIWRQCLLKSRRSFLRHHGQDQMEVNLNFGISQVEYAVHESRKRKEYNEEWDKYVKSKEGYNKLREKGGFNIKG